MVQGVEQIIDYGQVLNMLRRGESLRTIAKSQGVSWSVIDDRLRRIGAHPAQERKAKCKSLALAFVKYRESKRA